MLDNKKKIVIIISIICAIILCYIYYKFTKDNEDEFTTFEENVENTSQTNEIKENKTEEKRKIIVHIAGEVNNPGIIELDENSRVVDAINLAGGTKKEADLDTINLAHIVEDEEKIYIPNKQEEQIVEERKEEKQNTKIIININTAKKEELEKIPGIGESMAKRIIEYRNKNGKFKKIEDIKEVSGIGESKFNKIKEYITIKSTSKNCFFINLNHFYYLNLYLLGHLFQNLYKV